MKCFWVLVISVLLVSQAGCKEIKYTLPPQVEGFTAASKDGSVELSWNNPVYENLMAVKVVRKELSVPQGPDDGAQVFFALGSGHVDTLVVNGTTYYYAAFAYDQSNNYSASVTAQSTPAALLPGVVTGFTAKKVGTAVQLTWINPAPKAGIDDFAGVEIRKQEKTCPANANGGDLLYQGANSSLSDTLVTTGTVYCYTIFSLNNAGYASAVTNVLITP